MSKLKKLITVLATGFISALLYLITIYTLISLLVMTLNIATGYMSTQFFEIDPLTFMITTSVISTAAALYVIHSLKFYKWINMAITKLNKQSNAQTTSIKDIREARKSKKVKTVNK